MGHLRDKFERFALQIAYCGSRSVAIFGNSPVQASMKATRSFFSCSVSLRGLILSLRYGLAWPPLSYHSTTSANVAMLPSCM